MVGRIGRLGSAGFTEASMAFISPTSTRVLRWDHRALLCVPPTEDPHGRVRPAGRNAISGRSHSPMLLRGSPWGTQGPFSEQPMLGQPGHLRRVGQPCISVLLDLQMPPSESLLVTPAPF